MDDGKYLMKQDDYQRDDFYIHQNKKNITDTDNTQSKLVCKDLRTKHLGVMICVFKATHFCQLMYFTTFGICVCMYIYISTYIYTYTHTHTHTHTHI